MDNRVGIFIKIYRNEPEMHKALRSILAQTYTNYKVYILTNEKTKREILPYREEDDRVVVLNGGAQNWFADYMKYIAADDNKYITVIDADDWWNEDYLETLVSFAEYNNTDFTITGNHFVSNEGKILGVRKQKELVYEINQLGTYLKNSYMFFRTTWGKLYKATLFEDYDRTLLPKTESYGHYGGDTLFMLNLLRHVKKIGITPSVLYNYRISPSGSSYWLKEGRLDSDEVLFLYAIRVLNELDSLTQENINFLWSVFSNALLDTVQTVLNAQITEKEKVDKLYYVFTKETTRVFLGLVIAGHSYTLEGKNAIIKYISVFLEQYDHEKKELGQDYWRLIRILLPHLKWEITDDEFQVLVHSNAWEFLLPGLNDKLLERLFEYRSISDKKDACSQLMKHFADSDILLRCIQDRVFIDNHCEAFRAMIAKDWEAVLDYCVHVFGSYESAQCKELLIDVWIMAAAKLERQAAYILGRQVKIEMLFGMGDMEEAVKEYEELYSLGCSDENMDYLKSLLYSGE